MKKTVTMLAVALLMMGACVLEGRNVKITNKAPAGDASNTLVVKRYIEGKLKSKTVIPGTQNYVLKDMPNESFTLQLEYGERNPKKLPDLIVPKRDKTVVIETTRDGGAKIIQL